MSDTNTPRGRRISPELLGYRRGPDGQYEPRGELLGEITPDEQRLCLYPLPWWRMIREAATRDGLRLPETAQGLLDLLQEMQAEIMLPASDTAASIRALRGLAAGSADTLIGGLEARGAQIAIPSAKIWPDLTTGEGSGHE